MKRILFVIDSLACGGAERALISLLHSIDYQKFSVDLLYFLRENNHYLDSVPDSVNIVEPDLKTQIALSSKAFVLSHIFSSGCFLPAMMRILCEIYGRFIKKGKNAFLWRHIKGFVAPVQDHYDAAIGFIEGYSVYYCADKVNASRYIAWQRTDYALSNASPSHDMPYFEKMDAICVLSDHMRLRFLNVFPGFSNKLYVFPNIVNIETIINKSQECVSFDDDYSGIRLVSVGTLRKVKGYDVSIEACQKLISDGYDFRWYILGSGEDYDSLTKKIDYLGIQDRFLLVGNKKNPYPYMKICDIFIQASYREGFSTTVFEAKCLRMPIVITDAPGMSEQINDKVNGLIVPVGDSDKLAAAIEQLIDSKIMRERLSANLEEFVSNFKSENVERVKLFDSLVSADEL